jgi:arginine deiminase
MGMKDGPRTPAAYGGEAWSGRTDSHREEIGRIWAPCGVSSEWAPLGAVLLHRPGGELASVKDPDGAQMLAPIDVGRAAAQHDALADAYRGMGVEVTLIEPEGLPPPNLLFVADLMFMTPEGVILGRPASTVRAGEERFVAKRLAGLGIPILRCLRGHGIFECADAAWLDSSTVLVAQGLRTNREGAGQVTAALKELGIDVIPTTLLPGAMHLMGQLRIVDRDLAVVWRERMSQATLEILKNHGFRIVVAPDQEEAARGMAMNFVSLGPRSVLMPGGNPATRAALVKAGIECRTVAVDEIAKAAGAVGCMTGILRRAR